MEQILSTFARWMIVFALMMAYWPFGQAHATETVSFKKALYTASFDWNGSATPLRFVVGTVDPKEEGHSRFMALISQGEKTMATCERVVTGNAPYDVNAMTLRCEGALFGATGAMAKFSFASLTEKPTLLIELSKRSRKLYALNSESDRLPQVAKAN